MIKASFSGAINDVYKFIENRFGLLMAEKKLRSSVERKLLAELVVHVIENIDNTIFYLDKRNDSASMIIRASEKKGTRDIRYSYFGIALREKGNIFELYIDTLAEAQKKGLIKARKGYQKIVIIVALLIALIVGLAGIIIAPPVVIIFLILLPVIYPLAYFKAKKMFKQSQEIMNTIVSIFESEFAVIEKVDTKDWVNFRLQVKSKVERTLLPF